MSTRNPTTKRILKEASDLAQNPSPDFYAAPLESNLHEWHFTLRGPPAPSVYANGLYHGRIVLPPSYPLRPPSFRFLTPSGRFEVNREICLSISGFHEETWQPAWGVRTALVAIRCFMDAEGAGAVGAMTADEGVRRRFAAASAEWRCGGCGGGVNNAEVMRENERACREAGTLEGGNEEVPEELRLSYRDELGGGGAPGKGQEKEKAEDAVAVGSEARERMSSLAPPSASSSSQQGASTTAAPDSSTRAPTQNTAAQQQQVPQPPIVHNNVPITRLQPQQSAETAWLDRAIAGVAIMLGFMISRQVFS